MAGRGPRMTEFEERDYYQAPRRSAPSFEEGSRHRVITRSPPPRREDRTPAFLREDARQSEAGPVVLRRREVETFDRHHRSPSPVKYREERLVRRPRSVSPPRVHHHDREVSRERTRFVSREHIRSPSVERRRSPSPRPIRYVERPVARPRSPSSGPPDRERIRTRIIEKERERSLSSSSSSSSEPEAPKVVRGPIIEREVITHYRDIDHGVTKVRPPSPAPAPRPRSRSRSRVRDHEREVDVDVTLSRNRTEVDVDIRSGGRSRSKSRGPRQKEDELVIYSDHSQRRAHSAAAYRSPMDDEAEYIVRKIDSRGYPGEAWHGATKDWAIVDVPPGTERVRMDGIGGGSTDTSWTKYSGVRRTQFIPERDEAPAPRPPSPRPIRDRSSRDHGREIDIDIDIDIDIERSRDRRPSRPPLPAPPPPPKEMWTEISKDLVVREAIEELGYEYEDSPMFYYVMQYLRYDDVLRLTELSDEIRRYRKDRVREIQVERDFRNDWERRHHHHPHHHPRGSRWDDERVIEREREVIYDNRGPPRGYR